MKVRKEQPRNEDEPRSSGGTPPMGARLDDTTDGTDNTADPSTDAARLAAEERARRGPSRGSPSWVPH
jgi:hypothetical protein